MSRYLHQLSPEMIEGGKNGRETMGMRYRVEDMERSSCHMAWVFTSSGNV